MRACKGSGEGQDKKNEERKHEHEKPWLGNWSSESAHVREPYSSRKKGKQVRDECLLLGAFQSEKKAKDAQDKKEILVVLSAEGKPWATAGIIPEEGEETNRTKISGSTKKKGYQRLADENGGTRNGLQRAEWKGKRFGPTKARLDGFSSWQ